jgi:hypothetical protein
MARSPVRNSPRNMSQPQITGIAKADRKNTACPGGTVSAVALISEIMVMKTITENSFKEMALNGCMIKS